VLFAIGSFLSFDHASLGITDFYAEVARLILLGLGVIIVFTLIRGPLRHRMELRGGEHFASAFSFFATLIVIIVAFVSLLAVVSIPLNTFLVAVGGIGIVVGFAVSTVTTNMISGAFMLTSFPIKIGQRIIITINNQPGTITSISTLFMTVTTDAGAKLVIPNAAIFQGMAFMLNIDSDLGEKPGQARPTLLAKPGDRVISTLFNYPATVTDVTSWVTKLTTDTGQDLVIPNQALLNGGVSLVRVEKEGVGGSRLPIAVGDEVRLGGSNFVGKVTEVGAYYFRVSGEDEDVVMPVASLTNGGVTLFKKKGTSDVTKLKNATGRPQTGQQPQPPVSGQPS
ncbi:MAG: mechanosensitive ion channel domain-containing protein, partial [Nitrososphaerales archaeon]